MALPIAFEKAGLAIQHARVLSLQAVLERRVPVRGVARHTADLVCTGAARWAGLGQRQAAHGLGRPVVRVALVLRGAAVLLALLFLAPLRGGHADHVGFHESRLLRVKAIGLAGRRHGHARAIAVVRFRGALDMARVRVGLAVFERGVVVLRGVHPALEFGVQVARDLREDSKAE